MQSVQEIPKQFLIDPKAKNKPPSGFCCGWVKLTADGLCPVCKKKFTRAPTYESLVERFNCIIEHNREIIDYSKANYSKTPVFELQNIMIPVKFYHEFKMVAFHYFIEFDSILSHDKYASFFLHLEKVCPSVKL